MYDDEFSDHIKKGAEEFEKDMIAERKEKELEMLRKFSNDIGLAISPLDIILQKAKIIDKRKAIDIFFLANIAIISRLGDTIDERITISDDIQKRLRQKLIEMDGEINKGDKS